jgi:CRP/FNR family transcriptional regulator, anaerobic regulatory protein
MHARTPLTAMPAVRETVSRVLSRLARARLIACHKKSRRDIFIPDFLALPAFIGGRAAPAGLH